MQQGFDLEDSAANEYLPTPSPADRNVSGLSSGVATNRTQSGVQDGIAMSLAFA